MWGVYKENDRTWQAIKLQRVGLPGCPHVHPPATFEQRDSHTRHYCCKVGMPARDEVVEKLSGAYDCSWQSSSARRQ